jgi:hypothetical protein
MVDASPLRPNLLKGALAVYPTQTPGSQPSAVIVFQFNPDAMKRSLAHRAPPPPAQGATGAAKEDVLRVAGPPIETITMTVEMHASDQMEDPLADPLTADQGLHPALAKLELLMYPPTQDAKTLEQQAAQGKVQVNPADLPLVLLVWGKTRVVPVKITTFSISEDAFDTRLNPIAAKVELGMQVLTYMEFADSSIGRDAFLAYQKSKESLAGTSGPSAAVTGIRNLLPI